MKIIEMPYFMENEEWYNWTEEDGYQLTGKATLRAIQSYYEFIDELKEDMPIKTEEDNEEIE